MSCEEEDACVHTCIGEADTLSMYTYDTYDTLSMYTFINVRMRKCKTGADDAGDDADGRGVAFNVLFF